jgi:hypothetical protein
LAAEFGGLLRDRAGGYFADLKWWPVDVNLVRQRHRLNSSLFEFVLATKPLRHHVLVKVPYAPKHVEASPRPAVETRTDRPRLFPKAAAELKGPYEFAALSAIHDYYRGLDENRFGVIRMLDLLPPRGAVVMEKSPDPSLGRLWATSNRLQRPFWPIDIELPCRNAGAWLRRYHACPELEHTKARNTHRDDFRQSIGLFSGYLGTLGGRSEFFRLLRRQLDTAAGNTLPRILPLALGHGDYAPRNILVGPQGRVTVVDTLGRWRSPIYEDVASFLVALKASGLQAGSQGTLFSPRRLARYEHEFLNGYFEQDTVPRGAIRLFEAQLLLERWAALVYRYRESARIKRVMKGARLVLWSRFYQRYLHNILRDLADE